LGLSDAFFVSNILLFIENKPSVNHQKRVNRVKQCVTLTARPLVQQPHTISYWWSFGTKPLGSIFNGFRDIERRM